MNPGAGITAVRRELRWYQRLWVRIYLTLVLFTLLLAAIGLFTWEALNGFPGLRWPGQGAGAPLHTHEEAGSRPPAPPRMGESPPPRQFDPDQRPAGRESSDRPPPLRMEPATAAPLLPSNRGPLLPLGIVMMAVISVALLVVAYPVARGLARRIERIAGPVTAFGRGNLAARAPTDGPGEIGELAHEFNAAAERIEALVQAQKSLLANASHELRSPLARIQMQLEQIGERSSVDIRNGIRSEIRELDALVEEILLSSRLQSENRPALDDEVELLGLAAEEAARAGVDVNGELVTVRGDQRLLRRVIRNMVENAVRYSGDTVGVQVEVTAQAGRASVDVLDRGPGVPEAERERIFEPFYRARGAGEKAGGVGLGLSLARQIAREHGGDLQCLARAGSGGHFQLLLPHQLH